jgi:hypothetical protein
VFSHEFDDCFVYKMIGVSAQVQHTKTFAVLERKCQISSRCSKHMGAEHQRTKLDASSEVGQKVVSGWSKIMESMSSRADLELT